MLVPWRMLFLYQISEAVLNIAAGLISYYCSIVCIDDLVMSRISLTSSADGDSPGFSVCYMTVPGHMLGVCKLGTCKEHERTNLFIDF